MSAFHAPQRPQNARIKHNVYVPCLQPRMIMRYFCNQKENLSIGIKLFHGGFVSNHIYFDKKLCATVKQFNFDEYNGCSIVFRKDMIE